MTRQEAIAQVETRIAQNTEVMSASLSDRNMPMYRTMQSSVRRLQERLVQLQGART